MYGLAKMQFDTNWIGTQKGADNSRDDNTWNTSALLLQRKIFCEKTCLLPKFWPSKDFCIFRLSLRNSRHSLDLNHAVKRALRQSSEIVELQRYQFTIKNVSNFSCCFGRKNNESGKSPEHFPGKKRSPEFSRFDHHNLTRQLPWVLRYRHLHKKLCRSQKICPTSTQRVLRFRFEWKNPSSQSVANAARKTAGFHSNWTPIAWSSNHANCMKFKPRQLHEVQTLKKKRNNFQLRKTILNRLLLQKDTHWV